MLVADGFGSRLQHLLLNALLVAAVVLGAFGCGDDDEQQRRDAVQQEEDNYRLHEAGAKVVESAYDEGRLGSPEKVQADIQKYVEEAIGRGAEDPQFVGPDGRLIPFVEQTQDQQTAFLAWINGPEVRGAVGREIVAARDEARQELERGK
ncbi:MAG: hypothetical protein ACRDZ3_23475 [Acidimicrobiia bacterium]